MLIAVVCFLVAWNVGLTVVVAFRHPEFTNQRETDLIQVLRDSAAQREHQARSLEHAMRLLADAVSRIDGGEEAIVQLQEGYGKVGALMMAVGNELQRIDEIVKRLGAH